jgi:hypothetical protein
MTQFSTGSVTYLRVKALSAYRYVTLSLQKKERRTGKSAAGAKKRRGRDRKGLKMSSEKETVKAMLAELDERLFARTGTREEATAWHLAYELVDVERMSAMDDPDERTEYFDELILSSGRVMPHPQLFRSMFEDKPVLCFPVNVAYPPNR